MARVFLTRPAFVVIDEATSAFERAMEEQVYSALLAMGATLISATNDSRVVPFHSMVLALHGKSSYEVMTATEYQRKQKEQK